MRALLLGGLILMMISGCKPANEKQKLLGKPIEGNDGGTYEAAWQALERGISLLDQQQYDHAIAEFTEAIRLEPKLSPAYNNRGKAWNRKREYDKAINDYSEAIRLEPSGSVVPYINRGNVWRAKKKLDKAIADFDKAIELAPNNPHAFDARGNAWCENRNMDKGIADLSEAIRLDPKFAACFSARANAWIDKSQYDKAIADYTEAIRLEPTAMRYRGRALAWLLHNKDYPEAIADYAEAIRLNPNDGASMEASARLLAGLRDDKLRNGKKALDLAKRAFELDKENPACLETIALAYAETGDFEEAIRWQEKAVRHPQVTDLLSANVRLALYQKKQRYYVD